MNGRFLYCQNDSCREYVDGCDCICGWKQPEPEPVLSEQYEVLLDNYNDLRARHTAQEAESAALRADAERYRHLIDSQDAHDAHSGMAKPIVDSAVDAAKGE